VHKEQQGQTRLHPPTDIARINPPSFQATKKEPVDGSRKRLALQNTAGAATATPAAFINTKVFSESSESSVK